MKVGRRRTAWIAGLCAALLIAVSVLSRPGAAYAAGNGSDEWTIMLYLCGTDLESNHGFASINLNEICNADIPDDVNFLVETGGTNEWYWDGIDASVLSRFRVADRDLQLQETQPSASMGKVSTLVDFVKWGVSNYPSEHYALIFWDHGGGSVDGVCYDQRYDNDNLDMPELAQAMSQMPVTLDLIGFDACLMASLECAKTLQHAGRYMVASEETEPGYGWDYYTILNTLAEDTSMDGDELGRIICDAFYEKCDYYGLSDTATLSLIDLSEINNVNDWFDLYACGMAMTTQDLASFGNVAGGVERAESFGGNTPEEGYCNLVDLVDMAENTNSSVSGEVDASYLIEAIQDAVLYEVHGAGRMNANGLAIYYPLEANSGVLEYYNSFSDNVPYLQYIAALTGTYASYDWGQEYDQYEDEDYNWYEEDWEEEDSDWYGDDDDDWYYESDDDSAGDDDSYYYDSEDWWYDEDESYWE